MNRHADVLQLMVNVNNPVLHIQIADDQTAKLGNSHSGVEQDEHHLIVFAVDIIIVYKLQKFSHLIRLNRLADNTIIYYYAGKLKAERVLDNQIIIHRHLEGRLQNTANRFYCAVALAILLQLNDKELCVRNLDLADFLPAEWLVLHQIPYKIVVHLSIGLDAGLGCKVAIDKLSNCNIPSQRVQFGIQMIANLLFELSKGKTRFLSHWLWVSRFQTPAVNKMRLAIYLVLKLIFSVVSNGLASAQHSVLCVSSLPDSTRHLQAPPLLRDSVSDTCQILSR